MPFDLEDPTKLVASREPELHRVVYRRRGSDLVFAGTATDKVQVTRVSHRYKTEKTYHHAASELEAAMPDIKTMLEKEGYKCVERGPVQPGQVEPPAVPPGTP